MGLFERLVESRVNSGRKASRAWEDKTWELGHGVRIVVNPTVRCPWCEEDVETRRIWVVNEKVRKVLMAAEIGTGVKDSEYRLHPHVGSSQMICMGDAGSVGEALWGKVNLDSVYWDPKEWFRDMGHDCEEMWEDEEEGRDIYICEYCEEEFETEDDVMFCVESEEILCLGCWNDRRKCCDHHGDYVYVGVNGCLCEVLTEGGMKEWCEHCTREHSHSCPGCDRHVDDEGSGEWQDYCEECFHRLFAECWECNKSVLREEMALGEDGFWRCEGCLERTEEEEGL